MMRVYDTIIIGGGPAGYTAALYASRAGLDTVVVERMSIGGQMALTDTIENYPGYDEGVDGFTLGMKMQAGAERFGAKTKYAVVEGVELSGEIKKIFTDSGELFSKTVIIATGADPRRLGVVGEEALLSRGVHYCAHCDGRFYKDKIVAVIGGGNSAVSDAIYLSRLAKKVYLIHRRDSLRATKIDRELISATDNIETVWNSKVVGFVADGKLSAVNIENVSDGEKTTISLDGVFVSIGRRPISEIFADEIELDGSGYIIAGETTKTNIPGVFAVGDVRTKVLRQIVTAVGDGAVAAHFAEEYISGKSM